MANIFAYFDYHKFLYDTYVERKNADSYFSYRYMSRHLGIDAGYLVKVLHGEKNITLESVPKFAKLLRLGSKEVKYLELMLLFSKCKSNDERADYFKKMLSFSNIERTRLESDKYEFYQKWYHSIIREIIGFSEYKGDYNKLASMVKPPIKRLEAKKSVELLKKLGLVVKNDQDVYELTSQFITTGEDCKAIAIRKFQEETIDLAKNALHAIPKEQRDISSITISLSSSGFQQVQNQLKRLRQMIFEIAQKEQSVNCAYQLNLQFFPVSKQHSPKNETHD